MTSCRPKLAHQPFMFGQFQSFHLDIWSLKSLLPLHCLTRMRTPAIVEVICIIYICQKLNISKHTIRYNMHIYSTPANLEKCFFPFQTQEREAKQEMQRRAKELQRQRRENERQGKRTVGYGGGGFGSSSMSSSSRGSDSVPVVSDTLSEPVSRSSAPSR